jgi:hypothetical protein
MMLAMGLTAGSGPSKVSAEVELSPLSLEGRWEGRSQTARDTCRVCVDEGQIQWTCELPWRWAPRDEGYGRFSLVLAGRAYPCIYCWEGEKFVFCVGWQGRRPKSFTTADGQEIVWLLRVRNDR